MGIHAGVASGEHHPDVLFNKTADKVIINELGRNPDDRAIILSRAITKLDSSLSFTPSCDCGYLKDHLGLGINANTCPKCHTSVRDTMLDGMRPIVFIQKLPHHHSLIQPLFLVQFKVIYKRNRFDTLKYFLDESYNEVDPAITGLNLPRGIVNFMANIEHILVSLNTLPFFKKKQAAQDILLLYQQQKHNLHCNSIYLINRSLVLIDKSPLQIRLQKPLITLIDVTLSLIGLNALKGTTKNKDNKFGRALWSLAGFYIEYFAVIMGGKHGAIRTQLYNIRGAVSMYCVLSTLTTGLQHPEELHLPYTPTLHMFYSQVLGHLFRRGFTYPQAVSYMHQYTHTFSPVLHGILEEIVGINTQQHIDMIIQRYPTLWKGSMPVFKVLKVKDNAKDKSLSVSILGMSSANADADGDAIVAHPKPPYKEFDRLKMKYNMLDLTKPRTIARHLNISKPVVTNIMYWRMHAIANVRPSPVDVQALYGV